MFFGNIIGLGFGFFFSLTTLRILTSEKEIGEAKRDVWIVVFCVLFWAFASMIALVTLADKNSTAQIFVGVLCDVAVTINYAVRSLY